MQFPVLRVLSNSMKAQENSRSVTIWKQSEANLMGASTDYIIATRQADGTWLMEGKTHSKVDDFETKVDDFETAEWQDRTSVEGIRTPEQFVHAVFDCDEKMGFSWGLGEIESSVAEISAVDPKFASALLEYLEGMETRS